MIVYKYTRADIGVSILEKGLIRFTQASALNDPFEINPNFSEFIKGGIEFAKSRLTGSMPGDADLPPLISEFVNKFRESLFPVYLMLSLSKKNNSLLMWPHYADCHRGLVLGFDANHRFFQGSSSMTGLLPVEYSEARFVLPRQEDWAKREDFMPALLRKSVDWRYEDEMRIFAKASDASESAKTPDGIPLYLFAYPKECLVEVIFGIGTAKMVKQSAIDLVNRSYAHARVFQAKINENNFALDILPYSR